MSLFAKLRRWLKARDSVERCYLTIIAWTLGVSFAHGARGFWFLIPTDPLSVLVYLGIWLAAVFYVFRIVWFVIVCAWKDRPRLKSRIICAGGLLVAMAMFPLTDPYFQGARLRFWLQGGETAYLKFAADARAKELTHLPPLSTDATYEQLMEREALQKQRGIDFHQSLDRSLLDHHPTSWLYVGVSEKGIDLWSGSGLTGSWGILICDQPSLPHIHSKAETEENPYLPRYQPMSDRVWFWTSD